MAQCREEMGGGERREGMGESVSKADHGLAQMAPHLTAPKSAAVLGIIGKETCVC